LGNSPDKLRFPAQRNESGAYRETDVERTDLEAVIMDMHQNPVRVVGFNTAEKWSQDVSGDVAHELRRRCDLATAGRAISSRRIR
jgi:hypothetical protein